MDQGVVWLDQTRWQCTIKMLAMFTTAFCLSHVEHKLINLTLYNNSSAQTVNNIFESSMWNSSDIQLDALCKKVLTTQFNHLASLAKWLSVRLRTKWLWVRIQLQHLNFKFRACFEQGVAWHSGNYRVWIHTERRT